MFSKIRPVWFAVVLSLISLILLNLSSSGSNSSFASFPVKISKANSFVDPEGDHYVVGTVRNEGYTPVQVQLAMKIQNSLGNSEIAVAPTFGSTIYPFTEAPFKFDILKRDSISGLPYILQVKEVNSPYYDLLTQNYTTMNATIGKKLVGSIKNTGSLILHNVSVYASVHQEDGAQIDSVKSKTIPILRPGEEAKYVAIPDPAVQSRAVYFSCAGWDINAPINTIAVGNGRFIPYSLEGAAKITEFTYSRTDDSLTFSADHYSPLGGTVKLSIPEVSNAHALTILLDGKVDGNAKIEKNGKTLSAEIFVPPDAHVITVKGVLAQSM